MSVLPTRTDLQQLSVWCRVKFAVLCARRVQSLIATSWPGAPAAHFEAVNVAITFAESASATSGDSFFVSHLLRTSPLAASNIVTLLPKVGEARRNRAVVAAVTQAGVQEASKVQEEASKAAEAAQSAGAARAALVALVAARCAVMVMSGLLADVGQETYDAKAAEQAAEVAHLAAVVESCEDDSFGGEVVISREAITAIRQVFEKLREQESRRA